MFFQQVAKEISIKEINQSVSRFNYLANEIIANTHQINEPTPLQSEYIHESLISEKIEPEEEYDFLVTVSQNDIDVELFIKQIKISDQEDIDYQQFENDIDHFMQLVENNLDGKINQMKNKQNVVNKLQEEKDQIIQECYSRQKFIKNINNLKVLLAINKNEQILLEMMHQEDKYYKTSMQIYQNKISCIVKNINLDIELKMISKIQIIQDKKLCIQYNEIKNNIVSQYNYCLVICIQDLNELMILIQNLLNIMMIGLESIDSEQNNQKSNMSDSIKLINMLQTNSLSQHKNNNSINDENQLFRDHLNQLIHDLSLIQEYFHYRQFDKIQQNNQEQEQKISKSNYKLHKSIQQQLIDFKNLDSSESDESVNADKDFMNNFLKLRQERKAKKKIEKKYYEKLKQNQYALQLKQGIIFTKFVSIGNPKPKQVFISNDGNYLCWKNMEKNIVKQLKIQGELKNVISKNQNFKNQDLIDFKGQESLSYNQMLRVVQLIFKNERNLILMAQTDQQADEFVDYIQKRYKCKQ